MLWISSFYFFFGLEKNLATKYVDKNFQILYNTASLTQRENHWKKNIQDQLPRVKRKPTSICHTCGDVVLKFFSFLKTPWVLRKIEIPPSWKKHAHSWRMIEVASEQNQSRKVVRGETSKLIFFVSQSCKVKGKQNLAFSKHHPFFLFAKLLWRSHTCFDL